MPPGCNAVSVELDDLRDLTEREWGQWFARRGRLDISLLLFVLWDPCGVSDAYEAYDEYDSYAPACLPAIRADDPAALAVELSGIEQRNMGFSTQPDRLVNGAHAVIEGARASAWRWAQSAARDGAPHS